MARIGEKLSISGPPVHYLCRAVRNAALNYRRDRAREVELSSNGHFLEGPPGMADMGLALDTALRALPQEQREVIVLRVWGQMTFEEAAAALEIPANTAASRYRYALAKLREQLKPLGKE